MIKIIKKSSYLAWNRATRSGWGILKAGGTGGTDLARHEGASLKGHNIHQHSFYVDLSLCWVIIVCNQVHASLYRIENSTTRS